ncbi:hypothetical protein FACS1894126_4600 [Alphaproteobacteria bacterium]|nr:hypothetical protein FACS1894126_4600 [Alphaproteobacteria bacterium]
MRNRPTSYTISYEDEKSEKIFFLKEHALIGISPFNGYYTEERMEKLFFWALNSFQNISIFIPDEISKYTLQAVGYSEDKAIKKTKRQDNYLKHKAIRALIANKLSEAESENKIVCLSELVASDAYQKFYNNYLELYKNDEPFKKGCLMTSKWVLENKDLFENISDESVNIAVQYFLAELPLYLNTPEILGVSSSLFVYKDPPADFLKEIYEDNKLVSPQQGYLTVKTDNAANEVYINNILKHVPGCIYWKDIDGIYLGCNQMEADMVGLKSPALIIGKTDYELSWGDMGDILRNTDQRIMRTGIPEEVIETPTLADGREIIMLTKKSPLYDENNHIIGIIGVSIDITDGKKAEELQIKTKVQETRIEEQKDFATFTAQVLHDIISPLSTMEYIVKSFDTQEKQHFVLKNVITSIKNIVGALSEKYKKYERESNAAQVGLILIALALGDAVRNKKYRYKDSKIKFNYSFDSADNFTFVRGDQLSFECMISNLINNAVEACGIDSGIVDVSFGIEGTYAKIIIKDNGVGILKPIINKINNRSGHIDSTKHAGPGIGLDQVLTTIDFYKGIIDVESEKDAGTTFLIKFPLVECPKWIAKQLVFKKGDTVVVLDDDPSVFCAFETLLKDYSEDLDLKFFSKSRDALNFIEFFREKERLFFLCDYELRGSDFSGLTVILQSGIKERSLIITTIHSDRNVCEMAERSNVKILPKQFLLDMQIIME